MDYEEATPMSKNGKKVVKKAPPANAAGLKKFAANLNLAMDLYMAPANSKKPPPAGEGRNGWLAERMGVHRVAAMKWCNGLSSPGDEKKLKLATLLQVRVAWLFFNLGPMYAAQEMQDEAVKEAVKRAVLKVCGILNEETKAQLVRAICDQLHLSD